MVARNENDDSEKITDGDSIKALQGIITLLKDLDSESRSRVLHTAATFFGTSASSGGHSHVRHREAASPDMTSRHGGSTGTFSEDRSMSPKAFLMEKQPMTDVERMACLAYYLTHFRDTPHFKTVDLSKLNTEAAQRKLSNPTIAARNATNSGYLALASGGKKQLSAAGEVFVRALPDRTEARSALMALTPKKRKRGKVQKD